MINMDRTDEFNWNDFNNLADSYINQNNKAKQRTGISRYYYGTFCTMRDFLNENKIYLNKKSENTMNSKKSDVHSETSKIFRNHSKFQKDNIGKIISKELDKLRKMRNEADYDKITSNSLDRMIINSKIKSEKILKLLSDIT